MDGRNLNKLYTGNFDVVISPMNTIDYAPCFEDRESMLINMYKCLKVGGILHLLRDKLELIFSLLSCLLKQNLLKIFL